MWSWIAIPLFFLETIVFSILSVPLSLADRSGSGYFWISRLWSRVTLALFRIKLDVEGSANLDPSRNYVYAANHTSYLDIPASIAGIPDGLSLILRHTLVRIPIWGWSLLASPFIVINRSSPTKSKASIEKAVETIRRGASVLLFAEGTRTSNGEMQPFKRGAFRLAYDSGVAVVPVAIVGAYELLPRHRKIPRPGKITVRIGKPIEQSEITGKNEREREIVMMKRTEESVRAMLEGLTN